MKNIKFLSPILFVLALFIASCSSDGTGNLPDLERVPIPLMKLVDNSDVLIQDPAEFRGKFSLDLLFKEDQAPKSVDLVVARNGDYKNIKTVQAGVTSFPTIVDVDIAKLASIFGVDASTIIPGDYFEIGANITTQSGFVLPAFSELSNQFSADISNFPGSSLSIKYPVVCPLDLDEFVGEFTIDDPFFYEGEYPVTISREGDNVLVIEGFNEDATIKVTVNPQTTKVTVPSTMIAADFFGYTNLKVVGGGEINACANTITLNLTYTVDQGSFGTGGLTIKK
jgi:hypothetical protein